MMIDNSWTSKNYQAASSALSKLDNLGTSDPARLEALRTFLLGKRGFLLLLLCNPNLLEHDSFTELLWAVFHLAEELGCRSSLDKIPEKDTEHLQGDLARVVRLLLKEWLAYMHHLQADYPYLFSLAVRTNPFDRQASPTVE